MVPTSSTDRALIIQNVIARSERKITLPTDKTQQVLRVSDYFGENVFSIHKAKGVPDDAKKEILKLIKEGGTLTKKLAEIFASALVNWANSKSVTHFCHWFQPLTGSTAEKHDSFLTINIGEEIALEQLSASQLMQGEPDASSFPSGGSRSTFEARGYTSWDFSSPIFILESVNGKTLCIPSAFVSYLGDALDKKIPLLRGLTQLNRQTTKFLNLVGQKDVKSVTMTVGAEQEYFLVDKAFYYARPDLVMCGRSLMGSPSPRNQQLEDHYFGAIEDRVLSFMQELEIELYKLGIPAKTRHNEVAPGQYEIAQIFREANISSDQNQIMMSQIKKVAIKHNFVALLHEKPFAGINGSGKHLNWSLSDNFERNLLSPGERPQENLIFLSMVASSIEAVYRHGGILRASISGHGNDFRLGANEAPPSIISVYLGDALEKLLRNIALENGGEHDKNDMTKRAKQEMVEMGTQQLAPLFKDNSDRNRTSPFAFTSNKFEFRAVGSSAAIGFPASILVGALNDVMKDNCQFIEEKLASGLSEDEAMKKLITHLYNNSQTIIFNGDGYHNDWLREAEKRGLPNYKTTPEALKVFDEPKFINFLIKEGIFTERELQMRRNVLLERYIKVAEIEFQTLKLMVEQSVLPACITTKNEWLKVYQMEKEFSFTDHVEKQLIKKISSLMEKLYQQFEQLEQAWNQFSQMNHEDYAKGIGEELQPLMKSISQICGEIEGMVPSKYWELPTFQEMLFIR
jgi:glutamine synthetase